MKTKTLILPLLLAAPLGLLSSCTSTKDKTEPQDVRSVPETGVGAFGGPGSFGTRKPAPGPAASS